MNNSNLRSVNSGLVEIIIAMTIFMIASVFVVQLFVKGDVLRQQAEDITKATLVAQNTVEQMKAEGVGQNMTIYFDEQWTRVNQEDVYGMRIETQQLDEKLIAGSVTLYKERAYPLEKEPKELVVLPFAKYLPKTE